MQSVLEAAAHIAAEIEKTRLHLSNLEQALEGLRPLITVELPGKVLTLEQSSDIQSVEDVSVVKHARNKRVSKKPVSKSSPSKATQISKPSARVVMPKTGNEVWVKALGRKKLTSNELCEAVLANLGLGEESKFTIRNRAGAWLNAAVKKEKISASVNQSGLKVYQAVRA
jgi:hypothetical protein